jgi:hypothetical protein
MEGREKPHIDKYKIANNWNYDASCKVASLPFSDFENVKPLIFVGQILYKSRNIIHIVLIGIYDVTREIKKTNAKLSFITITETPFLCGSQTCHSPTIVAIYYCLKSCAIQNTPRNETNGFPFPDFNLIEKYVYPLLSRSGSLRTMLICRRHYRPKFICWWHYRWP